MELLRVKKESFATPLSFPPFTFDRNNNAPVRARDNDIPEYILFRLTIILPALLILDGFEDNEVPLGFDSR